MNPEITIYIDRDDDGLFLDANIKCPDSRIEAAAISAAGEYFFNRTSATRSVPRFYFPIEENEGTTDAEYATAFALAHHAAMACAQNTMAHLRKFMNEKGAAKFGIREIFSRHTVKPSDMWDDVIAQFPSVEDSTTNEASAAWKQGLAMSQP